MPRPIRRWLVLTWQQRGLCRKSWYFGDGWLTVWSALPVLLHDCGSQGIGFATEVGEGAGRGYNVNVPWFETKMGDGDYMAGDCSRD
jgi:hypothetical protein